MNTHAINSNNITFKSRIPRSTKKAIKTLTNQYLKEQTGYVSSKNSFFNGVAILTRATAGALVTGFVIEQLPKLIQQDKIVLLTQAATGIGSLAVAASRLEADKIATGSANVRVKPFVKKMMEKGYQNEDELVFGIKSFMTKAGGFFTSVIPNQFSSKKATQILKETQNS